MVVYQTCHERSTVSLSIVLRARFPNRDRHRSYSYRTLRDSPGHTATECSCPHLKLLNPKPEPLNSEPVLCLNQTVNALTATTSHDTFSYVREALEALLTCFRNRLFRRAP